MKAMINHAIFYGYDVLILVDNKTQMEAYGNYKCSFKVFAHNINKKNTVQIQELVKEHQCARAYVNHNVGYKWIFDHFIDMLRDGPKLKVVMFYS